VDCVLVTGATGNLGTALIGSLIREPNLRVFALARARDAKHLAERRLTMIRNLGGEIDVNRLVFIQGDISQPNLGLSRDDQIKVLEQVSSIIHAAASVRFDMPNHIAAQQNIQGTELVLDLARQIQARGKFQRLDYVSTCYIAGDRIGRVYEDECDEGQGFRNSYEWSKCQSELLVHHAIKNGLCAAIHRPSILAGDSRNGETRSFTALYWPLKVYARGWWRFLPGNPDTLIDVVPLDFVTEVITQLRKRSETIGMCFHLASGEAAVRLDDLAIRLRELLDGPRVRYVDQRLWRTLVRPLMVSGLKLFPNGDAIRRGTDVYMPYFESNPQFDTSNTDIHLDNVKPPSVLAYFDQIVGFACDRDFGRNL
jgi:thioester reductase-like protein